MSKRVKELMRCELRDELDERESCVVVGLGALDVGSATELRSDLREVGVRLRVLKNRVAHHALAEVGWESVRDLLDGPSAIAYGDGGALAASKTLVDWEKRLPNGLSIRGGYLEGKVLDQAAVRQLATIPDRPTLYSMIAAAVIAPVGQVASLVNDILAGVARAVGAVADQRQENE